MEKNSAESWVWIVIALTALSLVITGAVGCHHSRSGQGMVDGEDILSDEPCAQEFSWTYDGVCIWQLLTCDEAKFRLSFPNRWPDGEYGACDGSERADEDAE